MQTELKKLTYNYLGGATPERVRPQSFIIFTKFTTVRASGVEPTACTTIQFTTGFRTAVYHTPSPITIHRLAFQTARTVKRACAQRTAHSLTLPQSVYPWVSRLVAGWAGILRPTCTGSNLVPPAVPVRHFAAVIPVLMPSFRASAPRARVTRPLCAEPLCQPPTGLPYDRVALRDACLLRSGRAHCRVKTCLPVVRVARPSCGALDSSRHDTLLHPKMFSSRQQFIPVASHRNHQ